MGKKRLGTFRREPWAGQPSMKRRSAGAAKIEPRDWEETLARFEAGSARRRAFDLSSPGVAQVTRVRLRAAYRTSVRMRTEKNRMIWEKARPRAAKR